MIYYTRFSSPIGPLLLTSDGAALTGLYLKPHPPAAGAIESSLAEPFPEAIRQLAAYFAGTRTTFDLPLQLSGTPFQRAVWDALCAIPYGQTLSYGNLARRIGNPKACRAVGLANHRNPIPIIIPCHRVIGSSGQLVGFGGGLDRKRFLLNLESPNLISDSSMSRRNNCPTLVGAGT